MTISRKLASVAAIAMLPLLGTAVHADRGHIAMGGMTIPTALSAAQVTALTAKLTSLGATAAQSTAIVTQVNTVLADRAALAATTRGTAAFTAAEAKLKTDARAAQSSILSLTGATATQISTYFSAVDAEAAARTALAATTRGSAAYTAALAAYRAANTATRTAASAFNYQALRSLGHIAWDFD